ncbi:MAG: YlmC/YmxH family sporulation protein [Eubacteriales bacterium]|nr:YlmC/YmxH family sporulation protein [Eubacteriales bacterium]
MANSSDIRKKEVIDITTGRRMGLISDMNFSPDGRISSISVPGPFSIAGILHPGKGDVVIPWGRIVKIGEDVILVEGTSLE